MRRSVRYVFLATVVALVLSSCMEQPKAPLRVASSPWPGYEPLYLARDLGYLSSQQVNLFELPSADISMESFRNRSVDLATLTLDETLELLQDGTKLRVVLAMDGSNGADAVVVRPDIKTLADLKGKRIAITNIPLGVYMLTRLLEVAGLSRQDVVVLPMAESRHLAAYQEGKVDAAITFEPFRTQLIQAGGHVLFDSSQIPDEIFDLLLVHEDVFQQRREDLCELVSQWYRSLKYMHDQPGDAQQRITKRLGIKPADYSGMMAGIKLLAYEDNKRLLGGESPMLVVRAAKLMEVMQREKQLTGAVDVSTVVDPSFQTCVRP